jgi:putative endopeptidase
MKATMNTSKLALILVASTTLAWSPLAMAATADAPAPLATSHLGAWGFDLAGRDTAVKPGNDFNTYANGAYIAALKIPADRSRYGSFDALSELSQSRVHGLLTDAADDRSATGDEALIGAAYKAFMDEGRVESLGAAPLAKDLAAIRAADTRAKLAALMGQAPDGYFGSFFEPAEGPDAKTPTRYAVYLAQGGLGLPDRDYYLKPSFAPQKAKYQAYVARMLAAAGWPNAEAEAAAVVALETRIAEVSWTKVEERDPVKSYNPMTTAELATLAPGFPWQPFLESAGLGGLNSVVVGEKSAFPKIAAIFADTPISTLQAWQAFTVADSAAPFLSHAFADAHFEFRDKTLGGQAEQKPRWKRAASTIDRGIGEAVGRVYVAKYFTPEAKAKMEALVGDLKVALAARIQRLDWMSPATKAKAEQKLSLLTVKIGYPAKWRDYSGLKISPDDLFGDVEQTQAFEWRRELHRLNDPVDRTEWDMNPQTVNAYYNPLQNEVVFPAAILQPPFFDPTADMAVNFGGIGGVIGHEMTHGFDDEGRQFDGHGVLTDWWTPEDAAKFVAQTKRLGSQYDLFEPVSGAHVNGDLTMGENIADLGGLLLTLDAYHVSLNGAPAPVIDGLTGDQRVFLGWAQVWRSAAKEDAKRRSLVTDPHSPPEDRVNGVVHNIDAWYAAFNVEPGDKLYVAPEERVRIW